MKTIIVEINGNPILINQDNIVAIGMNYFDSSKTWIDGVNGEEYMVDIPYHEILKQITID